jgi:hypothetical protein
MCAALFPLCGGVVSSAMELTAVLANPAPVGASWHVLCTYRSSFEGSSVVLGRPAAAAGRFEGAVNGGSVRSTVAVMAVSRPRALQQRRGCRHSAWRGAAVAGMAAQG